MKKGSFAHFTLSDTVKMKWFLCVTHWSSVNVIYVNIDAFSLCAPVGSAVRSSRYCLYSDWNWSELWKRVLSKTFVTSQFDSRLLQRCHIKYNTYTLIT